MPLQASHVVDPLPAFVGSASAVLSSLLTVFVCVGCHEPAAETTSIEPASAVHSRSESDRPADDNAKLINQRLEFGVFWPPRRVRREPDVARTPLLLGEVSVFQTQEDRPRHALRLHVTLERPTKKSDRKRWNTRLAFPEHAWMAQVRIWDEDREWLWPNLPCLLRAHGKDRIERYGGIDPSKGVDNDFAAVFIRPIHHGVTDSGEDESQAKAPADSSVVESLVSAEWYELKPGRADRESVVHVARSNDFQILFKGGSDQAMKGSLGVWLIYADFLNAQMPENWPDDGEWAGGILAYFEVNWRRTNGEPPSVDIEQKTPPFGTGFDWEEWSTGDTPLSKRLILSIQPSGRVPDRKAIEEPSEPVTHDLNQTH